MKRFKLGFSLAEVLLALAIVAIIATLGFTMSRKGIEHAYNQYIYTGYNSMSIAIAEVISNGHAYDPAQGFNQDFIKRLRILLHSEDIAAANTQPVIANNFIKLPFMGMITGAMSVTDEIPGGGPSATMTYTGGTIDELYDAGACTYMDGQLYCLDNTLPGQGGGGGGGYLDNNNKCSNCNRINGEHESWCVHHPDFRDQHGNTPIIVPAVTCPNCGLSYPEGTSHTCKNHKDDDDTHTYDHDFEDLDRDGQDLNNGDTNADTTDYSIIKAKNGIVYTLNEGSMYRFTGHDANNNPTYEHVKFLSIAMSVPSPKNNAAEGYNLMYIPNSGYPLIPYSGQELDKIADRIDILSYVIDDGETGRVGPGSDYKPLKRYTFREAVCHYNPDGYEIKPNSTDTGNDYVDLFGCPEGIEPVQGALQLVGPRR